MCKVVKFIIIVLCLCSCRVSSIPSRKPLSCCLMMNDNVLPAIQHASCQRLHVAVARVSASRRLHCVQRLHSDFLWFLLGIASYFLLKSPPASFYSAPKRHKGQLSQLAKVCPTLNFPSCVTSFPSCQSLSSGRRDLRQNSVEMWARFITPQKEI